MDAYVHATSKNGYKNVKFCQVTLQKLLSGVCVEQPLLILKILHIGLASGDP